MSALSKLQPKAVFSYFERLCSVPHGSGNTKQISDLCIAMAEERGLEWRQDVSNNVVIWKKASSNALVDSFSDLLFSNQAAINAEYVK